MTKNNKKIGVVGCGKRFENLYCDILNKLNFDLFLWNRTKEKLEKFKDKEKIKVLDNLNDFRNLDLDLIICTIPEQFRLTSIKVLLEITNANILIETPVFDSDLINLSIQNKNRIGVLEQWPHLPLEQFKQKIYSSNIISRPYWVFNDGRTFDYHAISQLRAYVGYATPAIVKGSIINVEQSGHIDKDKKLNVTSDFWTHGHVHMSNGAIISHSFCYNCKVSELKPVQMIKNYSVDGSIVTGRIFELNNDYELAEIRYLDKNKNAIVEKIITTKSSDVTENISAAGIVWNNKFAQLGFNDQQTAIATVIDLSLNNKLYSPQNGQIDYITINAIKQSGQTHQTLSFGR